MQKLALLSLYVVFLAITCWRILILMALASRLRGRIYASSIAFFSKGNKIE
jgi:hypothetical protein